VLLQIGAGGRAVGHLLLGWASDRYGSKPVMLSGLYVKVVIPLAWMLMPRHSEASLVAALVIAFVNGAADIAWIIGSARLLFVKVVLGEAAEHMAVYRRRRSDRRSQQLRRARRITPKLSGQLWIFPRPFFRCSSSAWR
jgi:MFS family permease